MREDATVWDAFKYMYAKVVGYDSEMNIFGDDDVS